jgi:hypothetical protein
MGRENPVGLPPDPGRARQTGPQGLRHEDPHAPPGKVPDPRPGLEVLEPLRRGLPERRSEHRQDADPGPASQRVRQAVDLAAELERLTEPPVAGENLLFGKQSATARRRWSSASAPLWPRARSRPPLADMDRPSRRSRRAPTACARAAGGRSRPSSLRPCGRRRTASTVPPRAVRGSPPEARAACPTLCRC